MSGLGTDRGWQTYIVGELKGGDLLAAQIEAIWKATNRYQARSWLHYLHAKKAAIHWLLGNLDEEVQPLPTDGDLQTRLPSRKSILFGLLKDLNDELKALRGGGRPSVGTLRAVAFVESPQGHPDANAVEIMGNPNTTPYPYPYPLVQP